MTRNKSSKVPQSKMMEKSPARLRINSIMNATMKSDNTDKSLESSLVCLTRGSNIDESQNLNMEQKEARPSLTVSEALTIPQTRASTVGVVSDTLTLSASTVSRLDNLQ